MKKIFYLCVSVLVILTTVYSCQKDGIEKLKKSCLYSSKNDFFKKWSNTYTEIVVYSNTGSVESKRLIYPYGYFKMNTNLSYNVLSDGVPLNGTWDVNDSCQVILDAGTSLERKFDVLKINSDSLVIKRKDGNTIYTQHYASFDACPTATQLQATWNNVFIRHDYFNAAGTVVTGFSYEYPIGYFKINSNSTYNVVSNGVSHDGSWQYNMPGCRITLDKNTVDERTFDVLQFSKDTLTIWRKDVQTNIGYTQQYIKQ